MADTSRKEVSRRDRAYYRRRQQNHVFAAIAALFAEEAGKGNISKKELAEILGKDPAQITRWLSEPRNLELDTISDMLLAMGAEMDHSVVRFADRPRANFAHPALVPYLGGDITRTYPQGSFPPKPMLSATSASTATDQSQWIKRGAVRSEEIQIESAAVDG